MAKRPRGTGSIFRRGRIWFIQYFADGKRRRESSGSDDRKIAVQLLQKRLGEVATGKHLGLAAEKVTMGQLIDLVIADQEFRGLRSAKVTKWRAAAHFDAAFRKQSAAKFSTTDVERYITERRASCVLVGGPKIIAPGAANASINRELSIIVSAFTLGRKKGLVHWEPPYIPHLEEDNARQGFLEPEQYERVLEELPERLKALFVVAYHVGSRKGELLKLRWEQVDFEAGLIRLEMGQTKGKRPRTLPIYGEMERWLRTQQESAALYDCPWVFHYQRRQVDAHLLGWPEACERAAVPGLLFHDLRRSAVRNMKRAGLSDQMAMSISGHRTASVFRRYDIVDEKDMGTAGEKMEAFFEQRKQERAAKLRRVK